MMSENKKGVKLTIIDEFDYVDFKEIMDLIVFSGYKATMIDNGNVVIIKEEK